MSTWKVPASPAADARGAQRRVAVQRFAFRQQAQILARDLHRLLGEPCIFIAKQLDFGTVPGAALSRRRGHVEPAFAIVRHGQIQIDAGLVRLETVRQLLGRGRRIGSRDIEQQTVGENARRRRDAKQPARQRFLADRQGGKAPRPEREALQLELKQVFQEAVLDLQMLWAEKGALRPDHRLESLHLHSQ